MEFRRPVARLFSLLKPKTLQQHLLFMVSALVLLQIGISWYLVSHVTAKILREQVGQSALDAAHMVARIPTVRQALYAGDPDGFIQVIAENIRHDIGAEYVVVADTTGRRYSHPVVERIGQYFVGGDTGPVVHEGKSYVSEAVGTLGPSLRGFSPIYSPYPDEEGDTPVIGFASVGYLTRNLHATIRQNLQRPMLFIAAMTMLGFLCAVLIARHLKRITLGLEPSQIANLYLERGAVLEAIREGVVAVDRQGSIRLMNRAAQGYAGLSPDDRMEGRPLDEVLPGFNLHRAMGTGEAEYDMERTVNGLPMIINTVPLRHDGVVKGATVSFRRKDELDHVARELARVQQYIEMLRVQTHEYSNKLHTIGGLIQIQAYQEALDLVVKEATGYQDIIRFLQQTVPHPVIAAIILGKYSRAKEVRVDFHIDPESSMVDVPEWIDQEAVVTILGNLIDNAIEAVVDQPASARRVELSFTDLGNELIFEVGDSGPGIPPGRLEHVFSKGVSTKGKRRRGLGLYLVELRLEDMNGNITVSESEQGGALFTVAIPKAARCML